MNDQKLILKSKYEKYEMLLAHQQLEGKNKLSKTSNGL